MNPSPSPSPADIHGIMPPVNYFRLEIMWMIAAAVGILLLIGAIAWYIWYRKRRAASRPVLSPRQIVEARLAEIRRRLAEMDARTFGNEICDALRGYIGGQYGLRADRQTSPEFIASIALSRVFSPGEHALLAEFLEQCDLLKFAREDATLEAKERLLAQAVEFVEHGQAAPAPASGAPSPPRHPNELVRTTA